MGQISYPFYTSKDGGSLKRFAVNVTGCHRAMANYAFEIRQRSVFQAEVATTWPTKVQQDGKEPRKSTVVPSSEMANSIFTPRPFPSLHPDDRQMRFPQLVMKHAPKQALLTADLKPILSNARQDQAYDAPQSRAPGDA